MRYLSTAARVAMLATPDPRSGRLLDGGHIPALDDARDMSRPELAQ